MAKCYGFRADGSELKTQWETILYFLQTSGETITSWKAIKEFGFTRFAAIVYYIKKRAGVELRRRDRRITTRYGGKVNITEYWYAED